MELTQQAPGGHQRSVAPHFGRGEVVPHLAGQVLDEFLGTVAAEPVRARRAGEPRFAQMPEQPLDGDAPGSGGAPDQTALPDDPVHAADEHLAILHEARLAGPATLGSRVSAGRVTRSGPPHPPAPAPAPAVTVAPAAPAPRTGGDRLPPSPRRVPVERRPIR
ncbi:hypothetical protein ACIBCB_10680 [Streptomyces uncialis]|uniref:hypothetical protein n=1 Tax=Streptomyces uncialis TaxID=1048205 RepID=UPI0037AB074F